MGPYAPARAAMIYVEDARRAAEVWGLRRADAGINVILAEPKFDVVFERTITNEDGVVIAAPTQVAVDLMTGPGRNPARPRNSSAGCNATRVPGVSEADLLVQARAALLDALDALEAHLDAIVVIGAQAIYLRTAGAWIAVAEATKDSDLAVDSRTLDDDPLLEAAMKDGGLSRDLTTNQPGAWLNPHGIPVDLMVPEALAGSGGRSARGARIPPHDRPATRRARGLEATVIDNDT